MTRLSDIVEKLKAGCTASIGYDNVEKTMQEAAVEIERFRKENTDLASWQCIHLDGKTGVVCDEHGNQSCAKDAELTRLRALLDEAVAALTRIAAFDDTGAEAYLKRTGSYGCFDEPGSVQTAREFLAKVEKKDA